MSVKRNELLFEIIDVLKLLGGKGYLNEIYSLIQQRGNVDLSVYKYPDSTIRSTIYRYSSDCSKYIGKEDCFYSVNGNGSGEWAIREEDVSILYEFPEGKEQYKLHKTRERNPKVINKAKDDFIKLNGRLYCQVCNFDFEDTYGELGKEYIEGHHIVPVSELVEGSKTKPSDILLICSNCHRMLHRKRPWITKDKLNELIKCK